MQFFFFLQGSTKYLWSFVFCFFFSSQILVIMWYDKKTLPCVLISCSLMLLEAASFKEKKCFLNLFLFDTNWVIKIFIFFLTYEKICSSWVLKNSLVSLKTNWNPDILKYIRTYCHHFWTPAIAVSFPQGKAGVIFRDSWTEVTLLFFFPWTVMPNVVHTAYLGKPLPQMFKNSLRSAILGTLSGTEFRQR